MKTKKPKPSLPFPTEKGPDFIQGPTDPCGKCGWNDWGHPKYTEPFFLEGVYIPEHMKWTCLGCGFIAVGSTLATKLPDTPKS